jgi:hypothetical protein
MVRRAARRSVSADPHPLIRIPWSMHAQGTRGFVVDIFDEVEEDLRAERAQALLKRYGGLLLALALLVIGAAGGWQGWRWWQAKRDMAAGTAFLAAMSTAQTVGPRIVGSSADAASRKAAIEAFDHVAATAPDGYRTLARLRAAALQVDLGNLAGAAATYDQVAVDTAAGPLLRDLASLLWAQRQLDTGDPARLEARLKPLAEPANPWHGLASEDLALLDLRQGHADAAKATLHRLADDVTLPQDLRGRASLLLNRLGG